MAIKAVFFDWFNTLARYEPAREELAGQALREYGFNVALEKIRQGISVADKFWFEENTRSPVRTRSVAEQSTVFARHQQIILSEAGIDLSDKPDKLGKLIARMQTLSANMHFVLFDDVIPTLKGIKERKLIIGVLTNLDRDMMPLCRELGLEPYVDVIVTSGEIGVDKPDARIFLAALKRAKVAALEAILVGDQYKNDVLGAKGVGIKPLLIDRYNLSEDIADCPRLHALTEVVDYLK